VSTCVYYMMYSIRVCPTLNVYIYLIGGLEHEFCFPMNLGIIIPTDELIFFRGVETTNLNMLWLANGLITQ